MSVDPAAPPARALLAARGSFGVLLVAFVALLGGMHPSDRTRDAVVLVVAVIVAALNVPLSLWIVKSLGVPERRRAAILTAIALLLRIAFAAWSLRFIASISHEVPA
jgi:hypothetical protein